MSASRQEANHFWSCSDSSLLVVGSVVSWDGISLLSGQELPALVMFPVTGGWVVELLGSMVWETAWDHY